MPRETLTLPFADPPTEAKPIRLGRRATLLRGFAHARAAALVAAIGDITAASPFRHMTTPGGWAMSVGSTNCGDLGWLTDRTGYRYDPVDPATARPWPPMPPLFTDLDAGVGTSPSMASLARARSWRCTAPRPQTGPREEAYPTKNPASNPRVGHRPASARRGKRRTSALHASRDCKFPTHLRS